LSTNIPASTDRNSLANIAFIGSNEYLFDEMVAAVCGGESRPTTGPFYLTQVRPEIVIVTDWKFGFLV